MSVMKAIGRMISAAKGRFFLFDPRGTGKSVWLRQCFPKARIDIRRDGDAIVMAYSTMEDSPLEARYSFRIEPDGTNYRVGDLVSRKH